MHEIKINQKCKTQRDFLEDRFKVQQSEIKEALREKLESKVVATENTATFRNVRNLIFENNKSHSHYNNLFHACPTFAEF